MSKKVWVFLLIGMITLGTAAWYFQVTATSISEVLSPPGYRNIALDFSPMTLDVSNGSKCETQVDTLVINKDMVLSVAINENIQDDSAGECLDYQGDCTTTYVLEGESKTFNTIADKQNITIKAIGGERYVNKTMCCEAYSCPQTRTSTITLTQVA